jgi:hypothetical protein
LSALRTLFGHKPLWVTGLGWGTPPGDPNGISLNRQARYLTQAIFLADRAGAALADWNGLQDRAKPAYRAFRFPFLVRGSGRRLVAWGLAPRPRRRVVIERRYSGRWRKARGVRLGGGREFNVRVRTTAGGTYRARQGRNTSLPWRP